MAQRAAGANVRSGVDNRLEIFDGEESFQFEDGGDEYVRLKRAPKEEVPQPGPYIAVHLDFSKAVEGVFDRVV